MSFHTPTASGYLAAMKLAMIFEEFIIITPPIKAEIKPLTELKFCLWIYIVAFTFSLFFSSMFNFYPTMISTKFRPTSPIKIYFHAPKSRQSLM